MELYTLGYQQRSMAEFIELLRASQIDVLIDVRETAWSHKPGFSKGGLQTTLAAAGIEYVHAAFAGNPKRLRSTARNHRDCLKRYERHLKQNPEVLSEFDALLRGFQSRGLRVCLTCFERHPGDCHRGVLAEAWRAAGRAAACVRHLAPDGCPRLVNA